MRKIKPPCQLALWRILPSIRREIALTLIREHNLSQKEVAKLLGLTEAAISYYLNKKRGKGISFDKKAKEEIKKVAKNLVRRKSSCLSTKEICHLCKIIRPKLKRKLI